jgi:diguanylate cyclase (GGDEF)-like protein
MVQISGNYMLNMEKVLSSLNEREKTILADFERRLQAITKHAEGAEYLLRRIDEYNNLFIGNDKEKIKGKSSNVAEIASLLIKNLELAFFVIIKLEGSNKGSPASLSRQEIDILKSQLIVNRNAYNALLYQKGRMPADLKNVLARVLDVEQDEKKIEEALIGRLKVFEGHVARLGQQVSAEISLLKNIIYRARRGQEVMNSEIMQLSQGYQAINAMIVDEKRDYGELMALLTDETNAERKARKVTSLIVGVSGMGPIFDAAGYMLFKRRILNDMEADLEDMWKLTEVMAYYDSFKRLRESYLASDENGRKVPLLEEIIALIEKKISLASRLKALEEEVGKDRLTGICNRGAAYESILRLIDIAKQTDADVFVFVIDLDRFKEVNDIYGHSAGDDVLTCVAGVLGENIIKKYSTVIGRWGGDEFLMAELAGQEYNANKRVETIQKETMSRTADILRRESFKEGFVNAARKGTRPLSISASIGFASMKNSVKNWRGMQGSAILKSLEDGADARMYERKYKRNRA